METLESLEIGKGLTVDRSRADVVEFSQGHCGQPVAPGRNRGVVPATPSRDLLCLASEDPDGCPTIKPRQAGVLADALVALLSPGALLLWERGLGRMSSGSGP